MGDTVERCFAITDADLREVALLLSEQSRTSELEAVCARGRLILERCYGGSEEQWRSRRPTKSDSIRRLDRMTDVCPFRRTALNDSVGTFIACEKMPFIRETPCLNKTHVKAVLTLGNDADQERFLKLAAEKQMSGRELARLLVEHRRNNGERRGRRPAEALRKALSALRRSVRELEQAVLELRERDGLTEEERTELERWLEAAAEAIIAIRSRLLRTTRGGERTLNDSRVPVTSVEGWPQQYGLS